MTETTATQLRTPTAPLSRRYPRKVFATPCLLMRFCALDNSYIGIPEILREQMGLCQAKILVLYRTLLFLVSRARATLVGSVISISTAKASAPIAFISSTVDLRVSRRRAASATSIPARAKVLAKWTPAIPTLRSPMPVSRHRRSCRDMLQRAGRAPGFPQLQLLRFRVGDAFRLHVTKPTYGLGKRCELHGGFIAMSLEVPEDLGDQTLVIRNQLPLDATLRRPAERVKHRATQAPRAGK